MARITNFASLVAEVKNTANRADVTDADAEGFIQKAEARLNRLLRTWQMEESVSLTTDSDGIAALPADFLAVRAVYDSDNMTLPFSNAEWIVETVADARKSYGIVDGSFRLAPPKVETLTFLYYERIPALTLSNTTNWLLTAHPDIYEYGVLLALANWEENETAIAKYDALFARTLAEVIAHEESNRPKGPTRMPRDFMFSRYLDYI